MFKHKNCLTYDESVKVIRIDLSLPDKIADDIINAKEKDDKLNRIVYALIQDFEDPANALNCLTACLAIQCEVLNIDPVEFLIYMIKQYREFENEEKENA